MVADICNFFTCDIKARSNALYHSYLKEDFITTFGNEGNCTKRFLFDTSKCVLVLTNFCPLSRKDSWPLQGQVWHKCLSAKNSTIFCSLNIDHFWCFLQWETVLITNYFNKKLFWKVLRDVLVYGYSHKWTAIFLMLCHFGRIIVSSFSPESKPCRATGPCLLQ